jgi:N-methylhydantoinase A
LKLPVLDIAEVGAGGGSIVWVDRGGALRVGPQSAGAVPGPACYATGGTEPTVTDANVVLGYINPQELAGGSLRLVAERAFDALQSRVARPLELDLREAAYGVYTLATASMQRAVKAVSTYRGRDPRDFVLLAFGGNGPVFAAAMAESLGMPRVIVPPSAGLFSAVGLLEADLEQHFVKTYFAPADHVDLDLLNRIFEELETSALQAVQTDQAATGTATCERFADLRYSGQAFELTVPVPERALRKSDLLGLIERFGQEHERTYGHRALDEPVEIVNARVTARIPVERGRDDEPPRNGHAETPPSLPRRDHRLAYFGPQIGLVDTPVVARGELSSPGRGPLIVEEYDATTLIPPDWLAWLDEAGNIILEGAAHAR